MFVRYPLAEMGNSIAMVVSLISRLGVPSALLHGCALGSIVLCIALWIRAKTVDQDERGNAERRAIFVGLWVPMFWLIGDAVERHERRDGLRSRLPSRLR